MYNTREYTSGSAKGNATTIGGLNSGHYQYMSSSRGSSGDIGFESRQNTYKSSLERGQYSSGGAGGLSARSIENSRSGTNIGFGDSY